MTYIQSFISGREYLSSEFLGADKFFDVVKNGTVMRDILSGEARLGVGLDCATNTWFAITHTRKAALLYKYVISAHTEIGVGVKSFVGCDIISYPECEFLHGGGRALAINMTNQVLSLSGYKGSVTMWKDKALTWYDTVGPLYNYLVMLCRHFKLNIMQYPVVQFTSDRLKWCTYIEFAQTLAARRFFTKMFMESVSDAIHQ